MDLALEPARRPAIEISGYNLSLEAIRVFTISASGARSDVSRHLANPSEYLVTLNLGSNGVFFGPDVNKLEFDLSGGQTRTVTVVQPPAPVPAPEYTIRVLRVTGTIDLNDDENWPASDENKHVVMNSSIAVTPDRPAQFRWEACVGDEVQGYVDISLNLQRSTGTITGSGTSLYFEGTECGRTNEHGSNAFSLDVRRDEASPYQATYP